MLKLIALLTLFILTVQAQQNAPPTPANQANEKANENAKDKPRPQPKPRKPRKTNDRTIKQKSQNKKQTSDFLSDFLNPKAKKAQKSFYTSFYYGLSELECLPDDHECLRDTKKQETSTWIFTGFCLGFLACAVTAAFCKMTQGCKVSAILQAGCYCIRSRDGKQKVGQDGARKRSEYAQLEVGGEWYEAAPPAVELESVYSAYGPSDLPPYSYIRERELERQRRQVKQ